MPGCLTLPPLPGGLQKQGSNLQAKMPTAYFTPDVCCTTKRKKNRPHGHVAIKVGQNHANLYYV